MESLLNESTPNPWGANRAVVDDAMGHLSENYRNVLVLRFFHNDRRLKSVTPLELTLPRRKSALPAPWGD